MDFVVLAIGFVGVTANLVGWHVSRTYPGKSHGAQFGLALAAGGCILLMLCWSGWRSGAGWLYWSMTAAYVCWSLFHIGHSYRNWRGLRGGDVRKRPPSPSA